MKYRTKPFEVEAVKFLDNHEEVRGFVGLVTNLGGTFPGFRWDEFPHGDIVAEIYDYLHDTWVGVRLGDYIIKGMKNEFYPCDPGVFEAKYEEVQNG